MKQLIAFPIAMGQYIYINPEYIVSVESRGAGYTGIETVKNNYKVAQNINQTLDQIEEAIRND